MKLYDGGRAPNPRRTRMFLAEKGITVPMVPIDLARGEHLSGAVAEKNPLRCLPVLELDDGTVITESIAICRYFEAQNPEPNLFGRDPVETATIEMWNRRVELGFYIAVQAAFRHGHPGMAQAEPRQVAEWADLNRERAIEAARMLDDRLGETAFLAGDRFTVADITGFVTADFMKAAKLSIPETFTNLLRWKAAIAARASASA